MILFSFVFMARAQMMNTYIHIKYLLTCSYSYVFHFKASEFQRILSKLSRRVVLWLLIKQTQSNRFLESTSYLSPLGITPGRVKAKHGNKFVDFILLLLKNALRNPHQVSDLLFLEFAVSVKHTIVHLALKSQLQ